jgi:hypothetical protein
MRPLVAPLQQLPRKNGHLLQAKSKLLQAVAGFVAHEYEHQQLVRDEMRLLNDVRDYITNRTFGLPH